MREDWWRRTLSCISRRIPARFQRWRSPLTIRACNGHIWCLQATLAPRLSRRSPGGGGRGGSAGGGGGGGGTSGGTTGGGTRPISSPYNNYYNNPNLAPRSIVPQFPTSVATNQQVLQALADGTGGFAIVNTNDLLGGLDKIAREQNEFYLLGYVPPQSSEGSCHTIKVKMDH